jgi:hypothetical protein
MVAILSGFQAMLGCAQRRRTFRISGQCAITALQRMVASGNVTTLSAAGPEKIDNNTRTLQVTGENDYQ